MSQSGYTANQQRGRVRRVFFFMALFAVLMLVICGFTILLIRSSLDERREPRAVLDGAEIGTLAELPGEKAHPEALTLGADGNLYVGSFCTGDIWQITPEGELTTWFDGDKGIGAAGGMAFDNDGNLYVADRGDCDPREGTSRLKKISADGQTIETIQGIGKDDIPNRLVLDPSTNTLYFTDTQQKTVRYLDETGAVQTWWALPESDGKEPSPTGLAYDAYHDALVVADTNSGTIYRVQFDAQRQPMLAHEIVYQNDDYELDGVTVDEEGTVIFTIFNRNEVARMLNGEMRVIAEDFREPSDVLFVEGRIYVTNFDGVSLAPLINWFVSPTLPFTVDFIQLPDTSIPPSN